MFMTLRFEISLHFQRISVLIGDITFQTEEG
jgi:hypothetical protein